MPGHRQPIVGGVISPNTCSQSPPGADRQADEGQGREVCTAWHWSTVGPLSLLRRTDANGKRQEMPPEEHGGGVGGAAFFFFPFLTPPMDRK